MGGSDGGAPGPGRRVPNRIAALIYDFDDTIVESERINDRLFAEFLRTRLGIDLASGELELLYGYSWAGVFAWLKEHRGLRQPMSELWPRFLEVKREFLRGRKLRVATGLDRMLALPVPQAIVSGSTREEILLMLDNVGMSPGIVDFILSDDDCARGKPDPDGFLLALERLGTRAEETLVFEDSFAGIEAAHRAGLSVAFVAELASRDSSERADLRFESFAIAWEWVKGRVVPGAAA